MTINLHSSAKRSFLAQVHEEYHLQVKRMYGGFVSRRGINGEVMARHAERMVRVSQKRGVKLGVLMRESISFYSPDFCKRNFAKPWPPLAYVISDAALNRLEKRATRSAVGKGNTNTIVQFLGQFTKEKALDLIKAGALDTEPEEVKQRVYGIIQNWGNK